MQGRVEEAYRQTSSTYSAQTTKTHLENLKNQLPKEGDKISITSRGWQAGDDYARQGKNSIKNVGTTTLGQTAVSTA
ncbi:MAG: hypothetical protein J6T34_02095 [Bacilli bacterium]|nr:hypothetical protein [Bacilli bacterium]